VSSASVKPMPKRKRRTQGDARYWREVAELVQQMREQDRRIEDLLRRGDEIRRRLKARISAS
jgi:hypothetical protein